LKYTLMSKLTVSYIAVALLGIFLVSILANLFLDSQFQNYVIKTLEQRNQEIVAMVGQQYNGGRWATDVIANIGVNALSDGLIVKVKDLSGNTIWDATVHNNGLCAQMLAHMARNMQSRYPGWKGGYTQKTYTVEQNFQNVGTVQIGYWGPFFFNDNDLAFITTLNRILFGVGILSLVFSLILGAVMARRLTAPISRVIATAEMIAAGYYESRISERSNTREISQLTSTVNDLAETLQKQELLRKRLTADVAHELRTPLAILRSHLEAMIDGIWETDNERLRNCYEEVMRISRMVGELEKLARYESENLSLNKTHFDMADTANRIAKSLENDFRGKEVTIAFSGEETFVDADEDKIGQVICNLLTNALKYTPEGRRVDVSVTNTGLTAEVRVRDNGIGIAEEEQHFIFERFYRADKSRNRQTGGLGIGLAIAMAIIEAHRGAINVQSKLGEGTDFTVTIPLANA
jgi:two-component system sensor histidine kinase BaeS